MWCFFVVVCGCMCVIFCFVVVVVVVVVVVWGLLSLLIFTGLILTVRFYLDF